MSSTRSQTETPGSATRAIHFPEQRSFRNRAGFAAGIVLCGWLILIGRLIHLQVLQSSTLSAGVVKQSHHEEILAARPGDILDRNGNVLAMTVMCDSVYASPRHISDPLRFAWQVSEILELDTDRLYRRLLDHSDAGFLWLKRRVLPEMCEQLRAAGLESGSWGLRREYQRHYLQDGLAAHVIGLRDIDNQGRGGLEETFDSRIRGIDGTRTVTRDALGSVISIDHRQTQPPVHGDMVVCSLDLPLQKQTEETLNQLMTRWSPAGACAIVLLPHTGEVLSMASRPAFHPDVLENVHPDAWKNLAVSAVFEPGSTIKPVIVGRAVDLGLLERDQQIHCGHGIYRMGPRLLHDHHPYGELSLTDVLVKSSNIGMAKVGEALGKERLYNAVRAFGFGGRTGIELPGEVDGIVHPPQNWSIYSLGSVPMGQEIAVTPLQLITAHAAIANGGLLVPPTILKNGGADEDGSIPRTPVNEALSSRVLTSGTAAWLTAEPMKQVVERGTARAVRIPGLSMFGKTGTAQKLDPVTGRYSDNRWVLSFICGAPAENPGVLVLVMVDAPTAAGSHYGGTVAAPFAVEILKHALQRFPEYYQDPSDRSSQSKLTESLPSAVLQ